MRRLAAFAFSFSAAVFACAYLLPREYRMAAGGLFTALLLAGMLLLKGKRRLLTCLVCAGLAAGLVWTQIYDQLFYGPARELDDRTIRLTAVVTDYPRQRDYGWQVSARMESESGTKINMVLYMDEQGARLRPGDVIGSVTHCTLGEYSSAGEEITYYTAKGIFLWGQCYGPLTVSRPDHIPARYWPAHLAHLLKTSIDTVFPESTSGIVRAVVTGSRDKLTDEFTSSLERTGLSHTVAVSGMHLSCFAGILAMLLGRGRRSTAGIVIAWSLLFCGVAGSTPSVSRAAVMIMLLQLAPLLRRERDDATALGFALMLLLVWNPYSAAHVGLQLSFAAVAGIFLLAGPMQRAVAERLRLNAGAETLAGRLFYKAAMGVLSVVCTTLGAMVTTVPLTAIHFGTFSLIAPLSNLLSLWAVTLVFAAGMAVGVLGLFLPGLAQILALPVSWLAGYVQWCSGLFSGFAFAAVPLDSVYYRAWLILCYAALLLALLIRGKKRYILPVCCLILAFAASVLLTAREFRSGSMTVVTLDVGQGQSILLRCGDGVTLVDCGGDAPDNAGDIAADYLQSRGYGKLDILVLTHYHDDHANGIPQLLRRMDVGLLLVPDVEPDNVLRQEIMALAKELDIPVQFIEADTEVSFATGEKITLYPPLTTGKNTNELGLAILASAGETDVLITGDMSGDTEWMLLAYAELPDTELLVAGHHGAKSSTTQELLDAVRPEVCIISAGKHNRYGHPADEVLTRLVRVGAEVYRTDQNGTVTVTFIEN